MPEPRARHAHTAYAPKQVMGITYSLSSTLRAYSETPVSTACMGSGPLWFFRQCRYRFSGFLVIDFPGTQKAEKPQADDYTEQTER